LRAKGLGIGKVARTPSARGKDANPYRASFLHASPEDFAVLEEANCLSPFISVWR
jgi:hypothetical protein